MTLVQYKIIELFDGEAPECFGFENLSQEPRVGDVITLHWLDGGVAYEVEVVKKSDFKLEVKKR